MGVFPLDGRLVGFVHGEDHFRVSSARRVVLF